MREEKRRESRIGSGYPHRYSKIEFPFSVVLLEENESPMTGERDSIIVFVHDGCGECAVKTDS
jgi:hypothetical protein